MPGTWDEVVAAPEFNALPIGEKTAVRDAFFEREIAPKAPKDHLDEVRSAFQQRTAPTLARTQDIGSFKAKPADIQDSGEFWKDKAKIGATEMNVAFPASVADFVANNSMPGRLISALQQLFTGKPAEKSDIAGNFRRAAREPNSPIGIKDVPPTTEAQRVFGRPAEWAAGSLPLSAGNVALAPGKRLVTAATEALSTLGGAEGSEMGEHAGKAVGGDAGGAVGSLLGGLSGGGASAMAIPQVAAKGATAGKKGLQRLLQMGTGGRKLTEEQLNEILGPKLAQILKADPSAAAKLEEAGKVAEKVPGFKPDLASATGSTVIGAMKERVAKEGEDVLARFVRLSEQNRSALDKFQSESFPKAGRRPQDIARGQVASNAADLEAHGKMVEAQLQKQIAETDDAVRILTEAHSKAPSNTAIGERLTEIQEQARQLRFAETQAQYLPVYQLADQMGWQTDIAPILDSVRKAMREGAWELKSDQFPQVWRDLLRYGERAQAQKTAKIVEQVATKSKGKVPPSMTQFIAKNGGISRASLGGEFKDMDQLPKGLFQVGMTNLVRKGAGGKSADEMRMALQQAGYLHEGDDLNKMYSMIEDEFNAGRPTHFSARDADQAYEQMFKLAEEKAFGSDEAERALKEAGPDVNVSFREFHDLLKRVNRDLERPGRAAENLNNLKTQIKERLTGSVGEGDLAQELEKANQFWRDQWKAPFAKGAGSLMRSEKVAPQNIVQSAFLKRGERGAEDWKRIYGDNPEAQQLLYQGTADSFMQAATKSGEFKLSAAKNWLNSRENDGFLRAFPELRAEFDSVIRGVDSATTEGAQKAGFLESKLKSINDAKKELEKGSLAKLAGIEDTKKVAETAISSPKEMDTLLRLVRNDPHAKQGLATEIANVVLTHGNPEAFMLSHADSLKGTFDSLGRGHWDNLQAIVKGEQIMKRGGDPNRLRNVEMQSDPMQQMLGTSSSSLFSLAKGMGSWVSPGYAVFHVGGRYLFKVRADQQREFMVELLTNPDVAKKLADTYKNVTPATAEEMAKGLYNQGSREAREQLRAIQEEIAPMLRLHGIRVAVNTVNEAGMDQYRKDEERKAAARTQFGLKDQGAKRMRDLTGMGYRP